MIVAIDGPAGSGKTTIAKQLAKNLNIFYLDTGATYRALTLKALESNMDLKDVQALVELAECLDIEFKDKRTYLDGKDVSDKIRMPLIDKNISIIVSYPEVRSVMVKLQRSLSQNADFVVEGRDITTVVFPNAKFKFYLDANPEIRAKRRFEELEQKGVKVDFKELEKDLNRRDDADKNRKVGALTKSPDAIVIDTSDLTIDGVVQKMMDCIKEK
ncbi:MAG: (d)CMP kinase [Candidatus Omnitrophota bacterium]